MYHTTSPSDLSPVQTSHHGKLHRTGQRCCKVLLRQCYLAPQCPDTPMLSAASKAQPLLHFAPPQGCRALPDISISLMSHRYVLHATAAHKLIAHTAASPLLVVVSFNTVIYLPRGWLAWMEDLVVSEDMYLSTVLMTKLAKRTKCFSLGYSANRSALLINTQSVCSTTFSPEY